MQLAKRRSHSVRSNDERPIAVCVFDADGRRHGSFFPGRRSLPADRLIIPIINTPDSMEETKTDLLADLHLTAGSYPVLDQFVRGDHKYIRDLRINLKNTIESAHFSKKESFLIALSVAANEKNIILTECFASSAREHGATDSEIAETYAVASLLSSLNVYYRFKHFSSNKNYDAKQAGIKMTIMARPVLGKAFFELLSLVVSAVNGCETCVTNHEQSVRREGGTEEQIFDAIRLGSVIKGLSAAIY